MTDIIFIAVLIAFFGLAVLFVRGCERIIGPDLEADTPTEASPADKAAA